MMLILIIIQYFPWPTINILPLNYLSFSIYYFRFQIFEVFCHHCYRSSRPEVFYEKKVFLEILQSSQEKPVPQVFSCEFCEICKTTIFAEQL